MSQVTDVILTCSLAEEQGSDYACPVVENLNTWLYSKGYGTLTRVDDLAGGKKAMQGVVFMGSFNYLDLNGFSKIVTEAPWEYPEAVQILIKKEEDTVFSFLPL